MTGHALIMGPDGVEVAEFPAAGADVSAFLRAVIDCRTIELVRLNAVMDLWIDEEGKFTEAPVVNRVATAMAHICGAIADDDVIVGTAVLLAHSGPEAIGLSTEQVLALIGGDR